MHEHLRQQQLSGAPPAAKKTQSGEAVVESGIYRVWHPEHKLAREVILVRGMQFPKCPRCNAPIYFELAMAAPYVGDDPDFADSSKREKD